MSFLAAVIQLNSGSDEERNLQTAEELVAEGASRGAELVATPENVNFLGPHDEKVRRAEGLEGRVCRLFAEWARRWRIHLLLGSFNERSDDPARCYNTSVLFGPEGDVLASYRKIHLFDIDLPPVRFQESKYVAGGDKIAVVESGLAHCGFSVCYDLRFGELYRRLRAAGAELIFVPSAFTSVTGRSHWRPLLRARAIETQSYILAPAQWGRHDDQGLRESWGRAMIVDPWGEVIATVEEGSGLALAEIDLEHLKEVRASMPVERHRRLGTTVE